MLRYIIRRLLQAIPTMLGITLLSYALITAAPGGPVKLLTFSPKATQAQRDLLAKQLGVDRPWPEQYLRWLGNVLRGDFGKSFTSGRPAIDLIIERAPATLELGGLALLFGVLLGVPIGIWAAVKQGGVFDNVTRVLAVITSAVPTFWLGLILILVFGAKLKILPMGGRFPTNLSGEYTLLDRVRYLTMPVFVLSMGYVAAFSRYMRASTLEVARQDYIRTAQSKGLGETAVWFGHAARNAIIPLATFLGPAIVGLLGGAVITEVVFSWPGLGRLAFEAVNSLDYPVVMATTLIAGVSTVLGYLLSDIMYAFIDPRIRYT